MKWKIAEEFFLCVAVVQHLPAFNVSSRHTFISASSYSFSFGRLSTSFWTFVGKTREIELFSSYLAVFNDFFSSGEFNKEGKR